MTKTTCLLRILAGPAMATLPIAIHSQQLIANGNFESGTLSGWEVSAPAGTSVTVVNDNSPFLSPYPAGTKAVRLADDDVEFDSPFFKQSFTAQPAVTFSFDFKAPATSAGSSWYVIWTGDQDTTAFFFSIGGVDGASINLNQDKIATLEPNMWYHLEGTASAPGQSVTGSVLNSRGDRTPFSGGFPFGVQSVLNRVTVTDGDQARNEALIVDNLSAVPATVISKAFLNITPAPGGQVTLSWTASGYRLQGTSQLRPGAEWTNLDAPNQSYTTPADQPARFFRLISN